MKWWCQQLEPTPPHRTVSLPSLGYQANLSSNGQPTHMLQAPERWELGFGGACMPADVSRGAWMPECTTPGTPSIGQILTGHRSSMTGSKWSFSAVQSDTVKTRRLHVWVWSLRTVGAPPPSSPGKQDASCNECCFPCLAYQRCHETANTDQPVRCMHPKPSGERLPLRSCSKSADVRKL